MKHVLIVFILKHSLAHTNKPYGKPQRVYMIAVIKILKDDQRKVLSATTDWTFDRRHHLLTCTVYVCLSA